MIDGLAVEGAIATAVDLELRDLAADSEIVVVPVAEDGRDADPMLPSAHCQGGMANFADAGAVPLVDLAAALLCPMCWPSRRHVTVAILVAGGTGTSTRVAGNVVDRRQRAGVGCVFRARDRGVVDEAGRDHAVLGWQRRCAARPAGSSRATAGSRTCVDPDAPRQRPLVAGPASAAPSRGRRKCGTKLRGVERWLARIETTTRPIGSGMRRPWRTLTSAPPSTPTERRSLRFSGATGGPSSSTSLGVTM